MLFAVYGISHEPGCQTDDSGLASPAGAGRVHHKETLGILRRAGRGNQITWLGFFLPTEVFSYIFENAALVFMSH